MNLLSYPPSQAVTYSFFEPIFLIMHKTKFTATISLLDQSIDNTCSRSDFQLRYRAPS